jgi:two-component sensor histidine kinase
MTALYERLYQNTIYCENISVLSYLNPLVDQILDLFPESGSIKVTKTIEDFPLNASKLLLSGIIINELITNALKYAFKENQERTLSIAFNRVSDQAVIIIEDNGSGIKTDFIAESSDNFGVFMVNALTDQLNGTITLENQPGARFTISFPV